MNNKTMYVDKISEYYFCGKQILFFEGGSYELPYNIKRSEGAHSYETCEGCKTNKETLINRLKEVTVNFPNCCEIHKKLFQLNEFVIDDFKGLEESIVDKILFIHQHIINHISDEDWFEDFINYFEYVVESFGSFPTGYGSSYQLSFFYYNIKDDIENQIDKLTSDKISVSEINRRLKQIVIYIEKVFNPKQEENNNDWSFNVLLNTYEKWYKTFPFELTYFSHLKEKYSKQIPILKKKSIYNKYSNKTKHILHTNESFANFLKELTTHIITNINGLRLYEKGLLTDSQSIKLELILQNRELELKEINLLKINDRQSYIKVLKSWFKQEKAFINEMIPILESKNIEKKANELRPNRTDLAYFIYYLSESKVTILKNTFPSVSAWLELGEMYKKNSKNIQQMYNQIYNDRGLRLSKSKINNINYVIENMLVDYEKAQNLAKDELKLAKLNL